MGKFKEFLLREEIGLGELGPRIYQTFNDPGLGNQIAGAFASSDVTGSEQSPTLGLSGHSLHLPSTDLTIPSVEKTGRITILMTNKNPIYVRLSDGTEAHFTYDEYRKIEGEPALGKNMTIIFQRHPEDVTKQTSKIDKCIVQD
jgi:hypothetical protein